MTSRRDDSQAISAQAAEWLVVLSEGSASDHAAFLAWLRKSPRHVEEFLRSTTIWNDLGSIEAQRRTDVNAILAELRTAEAMANNVVSLDSTRVDAHESRAVPRPRAPAASQSRLTRWLAGLAATLLIISFGLWRLDGVRTYSTDVGEQRTVRLEDGSILYLNTDSRARVQISAQMRQIDLLEGEVLFAVAHDPSRPFRVRTSGLIVQAVGTKFNVRLLPNDSTRVSVLEGRVKVARDEEALSVPPSQTPESTAELPKLSRPPASAAAVTLLGSGEEASVAANKRIVSRKVADIDQTVSWRERRLIFRSERLENVAAELNRYSTRQFHIEGQQARDTRLTATFDVDNPALLAEFLQKYSNLSIEAQGDDFVIRER
jgi:transmembrane sensor